MALNAVQIMRKQRANAAAQSDFQIGCDIDPDLFKAGCRAPVFPGLWNRWFVVINEGFGASFGESTETQRIDAIGHMVCSWFNLLEDEKVWQDCDSTDIIITPANIMAFPWGEKALAEVTACNPKVELKTPTAVTPYLVEFVYRGSRADIPWPVWKGALPYKADFNPLTQFRNSWCPIECDIAVYSVYDASTLSTVPLGSPPDAKGRPVPKRAPPDKNLFPDIGKVDIPGLVWIGAALLAALAVVRITK